MTTFEAFDVRAILTEKIKKQIDDGTLKIDGLQLRDSRGRFTTPLNTLIATDKCKYSASLVVPFQNEFLVSLSIMNREIRAGFREQSEHLSHIEHKLDRLLVNEMDRLNAEINFFFSEVSDLDKCDNVRIEYHLCNGGRTAALLAQKMEQFIDSYINDMCCKSQGYSIRTMTYGELKRTGGKQHVGHNNVVEYPCFQGSVIEIYIRAFLEMLNSLNILSLIHRGRNSPDYLINLDGLKNTLVAFLKKLAVDDLQKSFGDEYPGFRDMCYTIYKKYQDNRITYLYRGNLEAERLSLYFSEFSSNSLAVRERMQCDSGVHQDEHLHHAITEVLDILESIENLKMRASTLPDTEEERILAISVLSDKFFLGCKENEVALSGSA